MNNWRPCTIGQNESALGPALRATAAPVLRRRGHLPRLAGALQHARRDGAVHGGIGESTEVAAVSFQQRPRKTRAPRESATFLFLATAQILPLDDGRKSRLAEEKHKHQPMQFCPEHPLGENFHDASYERR